MTIPLVHVRRYVIAALTALTGLALAMMLQGWWSSTSSAMQGSPDALVAVATDDPADVDACIARAAIGRTAAGINRGARVGEGARSPSDT